MSHLCNPVETFMNAEYEALVLLRNNPEKTNGEIGKMTGVTRRRVSRLRKEMAEPAREDVKSGTYFITDGTGYVKIGKSKDADHRMSELQCASPRQLVLLGVCDHNECELHVKFAHYHVRGEWFVLSDEIKTFIENNCEVPT